MEQKEAPSPDKAPGTKAASLSPAQVLELIREHIDDHEKSRVSVQEDTNAKCTEIENAFNQARTASHKDLETLSAEEADKVQRIACEIDDKLSAGADEGLGKCVDGGIDLLQHMNTYSVVAVQFKGTFIGSFKNTFSLEKGSMASESVNGLVNDGSREAAEAVSKALRKEADELDARRVAASEAIEKEYDRLMESLAKLKASINSELEELYKQEDSRLQELVSKASSLAKKECDDGICADLSKACEEVYANLVLERSYVVKINYGATSFADCYKLSVENNIWKIEERKAKSIVFKGANDGKIYFEVEFLAPDECDVLRQFGESMSDIKTCIEVRENGTENKESLDLNPEDNSVTSSAIKSETAYTAAARVEFKDKTSKWSDSIEFVTPAFSELCSSKGVPEKVNMHVPYDQQFKNLRKRHTTLAWTTALPSSKVTSWSIKVHTERDAFIGVAPFDVNQADDEAEDSSFNVKPGWYVSLKNLTLKSSSPYNYSAKKYVPDSKLFQADSVGVVMDTAKGNLSFVVNGVNLGVAYEGIPLDKPLVPCVFLPRKEDSVVLDPSEVKENVSESVSVPSNVAIKESAWDSIMLSWNPIKGVSLFQLEMDGIVQPVINSNSGLVPNLVSGTEHTFRVRSVTSCGVGKWCEPITGKTQDTVPPLSACVWRKPELYSPKELGRCLSLDNPLTVTKKFDDTPIGQAVGTVPFPPNQVSAWGVNIKKVRSEITVGVVPFDITKRNTLASGPWGWHFNCHYSTLWSGPPHFYRKPYGPRKSPGEYVKKGDIVWAVIDTTKGELSFAINETSLGVAYEGIPLDKPLVPCVTVKCKGDSVKLCFPQAQEGNDSKKPQCIIS